jgi:hypothetical protein
MKDEHYIIDLCDVVLKSKASRQHRFDFLLGDPNIKGNCAKLPVDAFYDKYNLVIEYREKQHFESVKFFDKPDRLTVSGVHRGQQREIYDLRRNQILPKHKIDLIVFQYTDFNFDRSKKIIRDTAFDTKVIRQKLKKYL